MNNSRFLALPLDAQKLTQQLNLKLLSKEKLTLVNEESTKLPVDYPTWVIELTALNIEGLLECKFVLSLVFILSPKWKRSKIVIDISLPPMA